MAKMEKKTLSDPEEKRSFDKGQLELVTLGGLDAMAFRVASVHSSPAEMSRSGIQHRTPADSSFLQSAPAIPLSFCAWPAWRKGSGKLKKAS